MKKRFAAFIMSVLLVFSSVCIFADAESLQLNTGATAVSSPQVLIKQLVVYCGGDSYKNMLSHLENSLFCSQTTDTLDLNNGFDKEKLNGYDCVFLDETVLNFKNTEKLSSVLEEYVYDGGSVLVPNCLSNVLSKDFLGIKNTVKLQGIPENVVNCGVGTDLEKAAELVCDFLQLFKGYTDYDFFKTLDFGYAFEVNTAKSIVDNGDGLSLYALNKYGNGYVLVTNPLLPNDFNINSFDRTRTDNIQRPYAATSAGANALFKGEFTAFVSKQKYGFALERTFGSYGTQPIAWQLHYEEITGIENGSSILFSEICKKYNQVPSFTLIRNTYKWFSRYEALSYLDIDNNVCTVDFNESVYSNGTHVISDNMNLYTLEIEDTGSYFEDLPTAKQRLFPCIVDVNNDGLYDVVCGSSDGKFYVYETKSLDGRWICDKSYTLKKANGEDVDVGEYSAPAVLDFDKDGFLDVLTGDENGNILFVRNLGNNTYDVPKNITSIDAKESMPVLGDVDGDGENELAVGSCEGKIFTFELGSGYLHSRKNVISALDETFLSPVVCDLNNDGITDIAAGTYLGYVRRFIRSGDSFRNGGYIMANEENFRGNKRVKFGNNCTPRFFDADSDGKNELVCGSLEYGLNVPIDSPYFPFRKQLEEQISYIKNNNFYLGVHFYTNAHASSEREKAELDMHKKAFSDYGINLDGIGANQHTWYMSSHSENQTNENIRNAGLLWNSGWMSSKSSTAPQSNTENVLGYPSFVDDKNDMLVFNTSTLLYLDDEVTAITAKYGLPFSVYYHCDFAYENPESAENDVKHVSDFAARHGLSFVKEDSFAKMMAASANMSVKVSFESKDKFVLVPVAKRNDFPLYDKVYADTFAVKIVPSCHENVHKYSSDALLYDYSDDSLTVTLNKNVAVEKAQYLTSDNKSHIVSVNIPCEIRYGDGMAVLYFGEPEYVEIKIRGKADCSTKGLTKEYDGEYTVFKGFNVKNASVVFG